jgi:hypothetical protein
MLNAKDNIYPFNDERQKLSDLAEIFSIASFIHLKNIIFYVLIFISLYKKVISKFVIFIFENL